MELSSKKFMKNGRKRGERYDQMPAAKRRRLFARVRQLMTDGYTDREAAAILGKDRKAIARMRAVLGIVGNKNYQIPTRQHRELMPEVVRFKSLGIGDGRIGELLSVSTTVIKNIRYHYGIPALIPFNDDSPEAKRQRSEWCKRIRKIGEDIYRDEVAAAGWPRQFSRAMCEVVTTIAKNGMLTDKQIKERCGFTMKTNCKIMEKVRKIGRHLINGGYIVKIHFGRQCFYTLGVAGLMIFSKGNA